MAKKKIIRISEKRLQEIISTEVERLLNEYTTKRSDFYKDIKGILYPIMDNLMCIAIFHTINSNIIPHWLNRAKQLPANLFLVRCSTPKESAINQVFNELLGEEFEDIDERFYNYLIEYYKDKDGKEKMVAQYTPINYHNQYTPYIQQVMNDLKTCLLTENKKGWSDAVNKFVEEVTKIPM